MGDAAISSELALFIEENIHSVEQLEVLLLLRNHRDTRWTAVAVSQTLRTTLSSARNRLEDLTRRNFVAMTPGTEPIYAYSPSTPEMDALIGELATTYASYRIRVIELVFSRPRGQLRSFADAFRLKKEEKKDDR